MRRWSLQSTLFKPQKKCYQVTCHQASQKACQKGILHGAPPGPMGYRESKALFLVVSLSSKLDGCRQHLSLNQRSKDQSCNTTTALALVEAGRFGRFDTVFFCKNTVWVCQNTIECIFNGCDPREPQVATTQPQPTKNLRLDLECFFDWNL